jgi:uracil-DNA glycosylase family 4
VIAPKQGPKCTICPLYQSGVVCADREPLTEHWTGLTVVGDYPGRDDVRHRACFQSLAGSLFDATVKAVGEDPENVHLTNAIRCGMPPTQQRLTDPLLKYAAECCVPVLLANLAESTTTAIALGKHAWQSLSGLDGIEKWRGCVVPATETERYPVVATIHPLTILREPTRRAWFDLFAADLRRGFQLANGSIELLAPVVVSATAENVLDMLYESPMLAIDVETDGKDSLTCGLRTIGLATATKSLSLPVPEFATRYNTDEWNDIVEGFHNLFCDEDAVVIFHNKAFDIVVLERYFAMPILAQREDTILLHHALHPKAPHDLQAVASHYLAVEPWKAYFDSPFESLVTVQKSDFKELAEDNFRAMYPGDELDKKKGKWTKVYKATWESVTEEDKQALVSTRVSNLHYYNAADTFYTQHLFDAMSAQVARTDVANVYATDRKLADIAMDWFRVGVGIDNNRRLELAEVFRLELEEEIAEMVEITKRPDFNPASTAQLVEAMGELGMVPSKLTAKGKISTNAKALFEFRDEDFIALLLKWREKSKLYSQYLIGMGNKLGPDGRLHPQYKLHVTPTGRFSTSPNLQNWPGTMKRLLVPRPGNVIISADFSALELRIVALLAGQEDQIETFNGGGDIHALHASRYFASVWDTLSKAEQKELRKKSKPVTFGDIYRAGAQTLFENVREEDPEITLEQVKILQATKRANEPQIGEWCSLVHQQATKAKELRTPWLGRRRRWALGDVPDTEAANHPIQGGAGDLMAEATIRWTEHLKGSGDYHTRVWPCLQIHDDLRAEVTTDYAPEALRSLLECMVSVKTYRSPVTNKLNAMGFVAEGSIGHNHAAFSDDPRPEKASTFNLEGLVETKDLNDEIASALFARMRG